MSFSLSHFRSSSLRVAFTGLVLLSLPYRSLASADDSPSPFSPSFDQGLHLRIKASLSHKAKTGDNDFVLTLADGNGKPVTDAKVRVTAAMTTMDMGISLFKVTNRGDGTYTAVVNFSMAGKWRVTAKIELSNKKSVSKYFDFEPKAEADSDQMGEMHDHDSMDSMDGMQMGSMKMGSMLGHLGPWSMQREGSGTSWLPDSSPMFMKDLPSSGRYDLHAMGFLSLNENGTGGPRGNSRFYSNSMLMLMGRRETGGGTLGLSAMVSLDPIFNGEYGYPNLFQTGETAHGNKLVDYQHPHDLFAELTASYSHPIGGGVRAFLYGGPVGEPALGGPTFMHRPSGMEIPEAPISHHWFDSTHISWGVATLGFNNERWQLEGSAFNGHEPNENRYWPDPIQINSASTRLTYNPGRNWSFNTSYGYLNSPESTEPGVDQHRITAAALWSQPFRGGDNLSATLAFGRRIQTGQTSDAFLAEATYLQGKTSWFARWEHVAEDELVGVPAGSYMVNKFLVGGVRNFSKSQGLEVGLGAYAGFYVYPSSLNSYYGHSPVTLGIFLRIRPEQMSHSHSMAMGSMHDHSMGDSED